MRVPVAIKRWVELKKVAKEHYERCKQSGRCPACEKPIMDGEPTIRDVHESCYHAIYRAVSTGKTTWEEQQKAGRVGAPNKPGRKPSNPATIAMGL